MSTSSGRLLRRVTRLDFLDGLGIAVGRRSVAFAHLVKRLATVTLQEHRVVLLPGPEDAAARAAALSEAVRAFLADTHVETDRVFVSVPRSFTIVSRLTLPAAVKSDLGQVLDFEVDRLLPLSRDEVYFDHVMREAGEKIEVLVLSVPRRTAAEILDALEEGGARVRSLVPTPLALCDFLHFAPGGSEGSLVALVDDGGIVELDAYAGGDLVASHVLAESELASEPAIRSAVAREASALAGASGEARVYGIAMGAEPTLPEPFLANGREMLGWVRGELGAPEGFFETASPAVVPAIGAGLAAVREGTANLNLLPAEERRAVEEGAPVVTFFLAALLVVVTLFWVTSAIVKDHLISSELRSELARLEPEIRRVHAQTDEAERLREKLEILTKNDKVRNSLFLQELTKIVPPDAYLTTFRVRNGRIELEGFAASASDLVPLLEKSRLFKNPQFTSPVTKVQNNQERFSLTADIAS